jgi:ABC-2 type transport system ATP-binding protein
MIEVQSLTRRYGSLVAVDDLSFSVESGEVLGFLGPNGAGKTTTMRILTGSLGATSGSVRVDGHDVRTNSKAARRQIGYLPEAPPLYLGMTVTDFLDHAARLRGVRGADRGAAIDRALGKTGLVDVRKRVIRHLSKGYRQRVGLAQALVHDPKLLVLDEPTSGLDPAQMADIRSLIAELRGDHTIVLSTHILSEVTASCDRVVIIKGGRLVHAGTEQELRSELGAHQRLRLQVEQAGDAAVEALRAVDGVVSVEDRGGGRIAVSLDGDVRGAVNAAASAFGLLESRSEGGLEEVYLAAVTGSQEGAA